MTTWSRSELVELISRRDGRRLNPQLPVDQLLAAWHDPACARELPETPIDQWRNRLTPYIWLHGHKYKLSDCPAWCHAHDDVRVAFCFNNFREKLEAEEMAGTTPESMQQVLDSTNWAGFNYKAVADMAQLVSQHKLVAAPAAQSLGADFTFVYGRTAEEVAQYIVDNAPDGQFFMPSVVVVDQGNGQQAPSITGAWAAYPGGVAPQAPQPTAAQQPGPPTPMAGPPAGSPPVVPQGQPQVAQVAGPPAGGPPMGAPQGPPAGPPPGLPTGPPPSMPPAAGPPMAGPPMAGPPMAGPPMAGPPMAGPPMAGPPMGGPPAGPPAGPPMGGPPAPGGFNPGGPPAPGGLNVGPPTAPVGVAPQVAQAPQQAAPAVQQAPAPVPPQAAPQAPAGAVSIDQQVAALAAKVDQIAATVGGFPNGATLAKGVGIVGEDVSTLLAKLDSSVQSIYTRVDAAHRATELLAWTQALIIQQMYGLIPGETMAAMAASSPESRPLEVLRQALCVALNVQPPHPAAPAAPAGNA
jgi:hypothetical protein